MDGLFNTSCKLMYSFCLCMSAPGMGHNRNRNRHHHYHHHHRRHQHGHVHDPHHFNISENIMPGFTFWSGTKGSMCWWSIHGTICNEWCIPWMHPAAWDALNLEFIELVWWNILFLFFEIVFDSIWCAVWWSVQVIFDQWPRNQHYLCLFLFLMCPMLPCSPLRTARWLASWQGEWYMRVANSWWYKISKYWYSPEWHMCHVWDWISYLGSKGSAGYCLCIALKLW